MLKNSKLKMATTGAAFALLALAAACGSKSGGGGGTPTATPAGTPTVLSVTPLDAATGVPRNTNVTATFSEAMDPATLTMTTFTLTSGAAAVAVPGTVVYADSMATFEPAAYLASNAMFAATVTTGAKGAGGIALAANKTWSFTTGNTLAAGLPVNLRTAGNFAILAKSAISTVPTSAVTGDVGLSPTAASGITGFSETLDAATGQFSTSTQVIAGGKIYAADYTEPTPTKLTAAIGDMMTAFTDAAGRAPGVTELFAGDISGKTLTAGVYKWGTGLLMNTDVTLTGNATDVFIFQIAQGLTVGNGTHIVLAGGVLPKNIFWQVSGAANLGTTTIFKGNILCQTAITLDTGASIDGRLLAQTAVHIKSSTVVKPAP